MVRSRRPEEAGFTFIELMVVIAIIGILAVAATGSYRYSIRRAEEATLKHNLAVLNDLINQYKADRHKYPESLGALVMDGYIRVLPPDPITKSADTWREIPNEPLDLDDPFADYGIACVQSGAEGAFPDGTPYAGWPNCE